MPADELLNPSIEQLLKEIHSVNHAWKAAKELFEAPASPIANSLRDLKTRLQVRLLRSQFAPGKVRLLEDMTSDASEPVYGLLLLEPVEGYMDAAHLPIRLAKEHLSPEEIERFHPKQ
jgi:hypothetical protein